MTNIEYITENPLIEYKIYKRIFSYIMSSDGPKAIYKMNDRCHDIAHFREVTDTALCFVMHNDAKHNSFNNMALLIAAAYHDTGRIISQPDHELYSCNVLSNDYALRRIINDDELWSSLINASKGIIKAHRSSKEFNPLENDPLVEYKKMLRDADNASHMNKTRYIERILWYYIDCMCETGAWKEPGFKNAMIENRLSLKGTMSFIPESQVAKDSFSEINIIITAEDIIDVYERIILPILVKGQE